MLITILIALVALGIGVALCVWVIYLLMEGW